MNTTPQAALLREAAQNALITLDGIASANSRDKADFETPDEWIAWAKSRARFAADALREPISQEVYAERILRQMLHESDHAQVTQADPVQPLCRLRIGVDGKTRYLGQFATPEEASAAYWAAKAELHGEETYQGRLS